MLEVEVRPPWPYRLPRSGRGDGTMRLRRGVLTRLLHIDESPVVVHIWQPASDRVIFRAIDAGDADATAPAAVADTHSGERFRIQLRKSSRPCCECSPERASAPPATAEALEVAVARMRFALGVDCDFTEFARAFRGDPLIGEAIHHRPWLRPRRRPWPWEALAWAVTEQLIEASRASEIQRWIVRRWGRRLGPGVCAAWAGRGPLRDVPAAAVIAGRAPAELAAIDLAPSRALALTRCAREVASGRAELAKPAADRRLARIPGVGPWTLQVLGFAGRGEPDSLPAGDLAYVKLVGMLAGLGRRATVEEVERHFDRYRPYRGLAGSFALARWHGAVAAGPPLRLAA